MSKLVGMAPRSWVDKRTGAVQERTVLWLERHDVPDLVGDAYDEVMVHPDLLPAGSNRTRSKTGVRSYLRPALC